ncbi:3'-5' exonuclease [Methylobacterium frigidaeris]|uniref:3'-5' exoribonuclease Rv2179c-like domain-containing protein n=1 Tax=Methylobacterium frigidaeris TaxID=2038277 RepID=A0AA37M7K1_9HYPH|nr:3'-5' exonuclease [Methylobacterium frigidaeris]PIK70525.1 hypothetical protein CS379_24145 [Methylobacterium frigidaeris]GJD65139.1 hypothetical protein MPEAHAMD_5326 [Methylobacterium frigidaeris]
MRDIMIDLETLSTRPDAMIVAIGAVQFGPEGLGDLFYCAVTPDGALGHIDPKTVAWWMGQGDEARSVFRDDGPNREPLAVALRDFRAWLDRKGKDLRIWGHGSSFDLPIIESAFRACGHPIPWSHRAIRDTRTLYELAGVKVEMPEGEKHHALSDAKAQALAVIRGVRALAADHIWSRCL